MKTEKTKMHQKFRYSSECSSTYTKCHLISIRRQITDASFFFEQLTHIKQEEEEESEEEVTILFEE